MSAYAGPEINSSGLIINIDPGNSKCYDGRENLLLYSQDFSQATWTKLQSTVFQDTTLAPDGASRATKLQEDNTDNYHVFYQSLTGTANQTYVISGFFKAAERTRVLLYAGASANWANHPSVIFDLSTGTIDQTTVSATEFPTIESYGNGWYRCSVTGIFGAADNNTTVNFGPCLVGNSLPTHQGVTGSGIYVWGIQLETRTLTPYTSTTTTAVTRPLVATELVQQLTMSRAVNPTTMPAYEAATGAFVFDGVNDVILTTGTTYPVSEYDPLTVEAWVYVPSSATWSNGSNFGNLFGRGSFSGSIGLWRSTTNNRIIMWSRGDDPNSGNGYAIADITRDQWYHVVGVWTGPTRIAKIYKNGVFDNATTPLNVFGGFEASGTWNLGSNFATGGSNGSVFGGKLAKCKVYNRELTATEIQQNFNAHRSMFGV